MRNTTSDGGSVGIVGDNTIPALCFSDTGEVNAQPPLIVAVLLSPSEKTEAFASNSALGSSRNELMSAGIDLVSELKYICPCRQL